MMSARNRPRQSHTKEDLGDEQHLWRTIEEKIKKCNDINKRSEEVSRQIGSLEDAVAQSSDGTPSLEQVDALEKLYREGVKLAEEESKVLSEEPDGLINEVETLTYIRIALEAETPKPTINAKPGRNLKRRFDADGASDSPGPSPDVATPASRLVSKSASRSGSVPASAKQESVGDPTESVKGVAFDKGFRFNIGTEVFYRNKAKAAEGEGILCHVTSVIGEGKQRRYEIQDSEPEPDEKGIIPSPYRASVQSLVAIPETNALLPDLPKGKQVLALYPNTTTFYKAEVVGMRKDQCRLRFEGEDEKDKEQDVDRRYVLDPSNK